MKEISNIIETAFWKSLSYDIIIETMAQMTADCFPLCSLFWNTKVRQNKMLPACELNTHL
jgi:hypothetical protein